MEISAEKTKVVPSNTSGITTEMKENGQKLETVTSFKYLCSDVSDEASKYTLQDSTVDSSVEWLKPVCDDRSISHCSKIRLMHLSHPSS